MEGEQNPPFKEVSVGDDYIEFIAWYKSDSDGNIQEQFLMMEEAIDNTSETLEDGNDDDVQILEGEAVPEQPEAVEEFLVSGDDEEREDAVQEEQHIPCDHDDGPDVGDVIIEGGENIPSDEDDVTDAPEFRSEGNVSKEYNQAEGEENNHSDQEDTDEVQEFRSHGNISAEEGIANDHDSEPAEVNTVSGYLSANDEVQDDQNVSSDDNLSKAQEEPGEVTEDASTVAAEEQPDQNTSSDQENSMDVENDNAEQNTESLDADEAKNNGESSDEYIEDELYLQGFSYDVCMDKPENVSSSAVEEGKTAGTSAIGSHKTESTTEKLSLKRKRVIDSDL